MAKKPAPPQVVITQRKTQTPEAFQRHKEGYRLILKVLRAKATQEAPHETNHTQAGR